jgi:hypothetical protein
LCIKSGIIYEGINQHMTPEEKLLALIQQDKRQTGTVTPQEKLLALIEQDKQKPEPSLPVPVQPVATAVPIPVAKPIPAPVAVAAPPAAKPDPIPAPAVVKAAPVVAAPPLEIKQTPAPVKAAPVVVPPAETKKTPLVVMPPAPAQNTSTPTAKSATVPVIAPQPVSLPTPAPSAPQPMLFPTIRISGVTITNRVLAVMVVLLIVAVFCSVAGTQRGVDNEIQKQMNGAGEMSVTPVAISDEPVPAAEFFLEKVSTRNFFSPKTAEKGKTGADVPETLGLAKDLKLVAVSMDAATASESMAIIKIKADSKTYFVKIGENVGDTGFVLTKVLADRIVLKQRKQEFELK